MKIEDLHPGVFHCPLNETYKLMPELKDILDLAPIDRSKKWIVDIKVHMLMPNQYPCIPNWHFDNIPRNANKKQLFHKRDANLKMYLWVSGEPLTEFKNNGKIKPKKWVEFTQFDEHRGTKSSEFTWRLFIRICPEELLKPAQKHKWIRRHSQVYLNANDFKW